ncbi:MAG: hypothetical protein AAGD07_23240 [Planctomycetota bacterium]
MFWPVVLPFQVTLGVLCVLIAIATIAAPLLKWRRAPTLVVVSLLSLVAFVPSCAGVMAVLDANRFGVFEYETFHDVDDFRVERFLPPVARSITVDKYAQGFRPRFTISQSELDEYLESVWRSYVDQSVVQRGQVFTMDPVDEKSNQIHYGDLGWPHLEEATEDYGPVARNGAGFSIWYSPSKGIAYQRGSYW